MRTIYDLRPIASLTRDLLTSFHFGVAAFVAGVLWLQQQAQLPALWWSALLVPLLFALRLAQLRAIAALFIGLLWASLYGHWQLQGGVPPELEGENVQLEGWIASLPDRDGRRSRFLFDVSQMGFEGAAYPSPRRVRLNCYDCEAGFQPGERYRFTARLKRPSGFMNPAGFDYEGWLFRKGVRATGYVRDRDAPIQRLEGSHPRYALLRLRMGIRELIQGEVRGPAAGLITALAIGDRSGIEREQWERYTRNGINHLVAISGLHIGIISGLCYWLALSGWRRSMRLSQALPAQKAGIVAALIGATLYAALAGFAIPTQRALIMALVLLGGLFAGRMSRPSRNLALALLLVVVWNPLAVLSAGFWFSYAAVAAIFLIYAGRLGRPHPLVAWGGIQWAIALALAPLLIARGMQVSLAGPLINLLLVPLFTFVVVPGVLLGVLLTALVPPLGGELLRGLAWLLGEMEGYLAIVASHPWAAMRLPAAPPVLWLLGLAGAIWALLPRGIPGRWLGLLALLPLLAWSPEPPQRGEVRITLLDVGQGMALVAQTQGHTLVYDTGPRYPSGFNTGAAVVAPFLESQGIAQIDQLVVSNGDMDHAGGLHGLLETISARKISSGEPGELGIPRVSPCLAGEGWHWDGVDFRFLHPDSSRDWRGNDASCALRISAGEHQMLVTGDIEEQAEAHMLKTGQPLESDLVIVPHHGSKSSSTPPFVAAVNPRWALVSAGYRNRFGLPREEVLGRWQEAGAEIMTTFQSGALQLTMDPSGIHGPRGWREQAGGYWNR
jgi:competence protein ComEC